MIAEIYSKISSTGSNISDRSEDQLTGNVFGSLRYLPAGLGLKRVLGKVEFFENEQQSADFDTAVAGITDLEWSKACHFWPYHDQGEIDILLQFLHCVIGIEVKFHSSLSSDDEVDNAGVAKEDQQFSTHQLAREREIVHSYCAKNGSGWLILLAKQGEGVPIVKAARRRKLFDERFNVAVGVLSWTSVLDALREALEEATDVFHRLILEDLISLLAKKGFDRFSSFAVKEPIPMSAAKHFVFPISSPVSFSFDSTQIINPNGYFTFD